MNRPGREQGLSWEVFSRPIIGRKECTGLGTVHAVVGPTHRGWKMNRPSIKRNGNSVRERDKSSGRGAAKDGRVAGIKVSLKMKGRKKERKKFPVDWAGRTETVFARGKLERGVK